MKHFQLTFLSRRLTSHFEEGLKQTCQKKYLKIRRPLLHDVNENGKTIKVQVEKRKRER